MKKVAKNLRGERGIRTLDPVSHGIHAFQACAFDHSAISPHFSARQITIFFLKIYL